MGPRKELWTGTDQAAGKYSHQIPWTLARRAESQTETGSEKRSASTGRTTSQPDSPEECARIVEASEREENELRSQIIDQLEQSLTMSREMMMSQKLDPRTREKWTQRHTNTPQ